MAPAAQPKERRGNAPRVLLRRIFWFGTATVVLAGAIYGAQEMEQFLLHDARFVLPGPADYGMESPNLKIEGARHASRAQILRTFSADFGRSVYLFPLAQRRQQLLCVSWVKDASIVRVWPNEIRIRVTEREPVAFLQIRGDSISRWALIDSDGVILDPPARASFKLPVVSGIQPGEPLATRGQRVRRMLRFMNDIGGLAANISEVDVSDLDDVKVTQQMQDRAVVLMLGDRNFQSRLQNFIDQYPNIHKRLPGAVTLDLRLDDRITVLEGTRGGQ